MVLKIRAMNRVEAPFAQLVERQSYNLKVASSILAGSNALPLCPSLSLARSSFFSISSYCIGPDRNIHIFSDPGGCSRLNAHLPCCAVRLQSRSCTPLSRLSLARPLPMGEPCVVKDSRCFLDLDLLSYSAVTMHINMFLCMCESMRASQYTTCYKRTDHALQQCLTLRPSDP